PPPRAAPLAVPGVFRGGGAGPPAVPDPAPARERHGHNDRFSLRRSNHINGYFLIPSRKADVPLTPSHAPARDTSADLSRAAILVFALACGVCVANVYFPQALSPLIARYFHATPATAALLVTTTQLGYAAGLYLLVPLGAG